MKVLKEKNEEVDFYDFYNVNDSFLFFNEKTVLVTGLITGGVEGLTIFFEGKLTQTQRHIVITNKQKHYIQLLLADTISSRPLNTDEVAFTLEDNNTIVIKVS